jgi:hypothetical protein
MHNNYHACKWGKGKSKAWDDHAVLAIYVTEGKEPGETHTREYRTEKKGRFIADTTKKSYDVAPVERTFNTTKVPAILKGKGIMLVEGVPTPHRNSGRKIHSH